MAEGEDRDRGYDVAVIGLAGRFPGAGSIEELAANLEAGVESVKRFTPEELVAAGVPAELVVHPRYVPARPVLDGIELFDAGFFGFNPREAQMIDPQQRLFLESCWAALESAGYVPEKIGGRVGVYAGVSVNSYLLSNLLSNMPLIESYGGFQTRIASDKDFLSTRVSYKLNLRGPSVGVQTACSTSLVAIHVACQALLNRECDLALSGGSSILLPQEAGYLCEDGGIDSPDGHCRPFDHRAAGTLFGNGVGVVVLKRLADALVDGDPIRALILGSAINNDGSAKAGYSAPSIEGQAEVVAEALAMAAVPPESITAIECHGTATPIGDVIEIAALKRVFAGTGAEEPFCAIGSIKGNFGHLDSAAGVAALTKTVLALEQGKLFPSLHYEQANPDLGLEQSPFYVNTRLATWQPAPWPRRAGVSGFGIGGTNAHLVLEEAPAAQPSGPGRPWQLLAVSAKSAAALARSAERLAAHLEARPELSLADAAYTLSQGRSEMAERLTVTARDPREAAERLRQAAAQGGARAARPRVVFLYPGGGAQYVAMGRELYRHEAVFRAEIDRLAELSRSRYELDLWSILDPAPGQEELATRLATRPSLGLPALFAVEHALSVLLRSWGIEPAAAIGHSLGEYAAAALAGVLSVEDALSVVVLRGRLFERLPEGSMLSVPLSEAQAAAYLGEDLAIAAVNGPAQSVLSGPRAGLERAAAELAAAGVEFRRVHIDVAAHSPMVEPILAEFERHLAGLALGAPRLPYVSNLSGGWIEAEDATDPAYWARHLRSTVRFGDGLSLLLEDPEVILLEVGPGRTLTTFGRGRVDRSRGQLALPTLPHPQDQASDLEVLLGACGRLWCAGVPFAWGAYWGEERRLRLPLPSYPFARERHWVEPGSGESGAARAGGRLNLEDWFEVPSFKRSMVPAPRPLAAERWLLVADAAGLAERLEAELSRQGQRAVVLYPGERLEPLEEGAWRLDLESREQLAELLGELARAGAEPTAVVHLRGLRPGPIENDARALLGASLEAPFAELLALGVALAEHHRGGALPFWVVTRAQFNVAGGEPIDLAGATALGPIRVLPLEAPQLEVHQLDLEADAAADLEGSLALLLAELGHRGPERAVIYRRGERWLEAFEPVKLPAPAGLPRLLRPRGVYLVTGGLGSMGLAFARSLFAQAGARLVLVSRTPLGPGAEARAAALAELEAAGAEVLVAAVDVCDLEALGGLRRQILDRFGELNGIFHTAGVLGQGAAVLKSREEAARVLAPKVRGTLALEAAFGDLPLDFFVLAASRSGVAPLPGQIDYAAANAFEDAFAQSRARLGGRRTLSLDWGFWQELGMAGEARLPEPLKAELEGAVAALRVAGLGNAGVEALNRALDGATAPQLLVGRDGTEEHLAGVRRLVRQALGEDGPAAASAEAGAEGPSAAASDAVERRLAGLWRDLLGVGSVGPEDDFFLLGGHSLLATRLVNRIQQLFGVEVAVRQLFEASTLGELAALLRGRLGSEPPAPAPAATRARPLEVGPDGAESYPLSFAQQRLYYYYRLHPESPGYNVSLAFEVEGALDPRALRAAFADLLARQEVLRTVFVEERGEPRQKILPAATLALPVVDLTALPEGHLALREVERLATEAWQVPFDLGRAPLLRCCLGRLGPRRHVLLLEMHHIATDAWSIAVVMRELQRLYGARAAGEGSPLPPPALRYVDFAAWQRESLESGRFDAQLAYWRERLGSLPQLALPLDRPRPPIQSFAGRKRIRLLPDGLALRLRELAQRPETTLFMVMMAAFQVVLGHWAGQREVVVGSNLANRSLPGSEDLVGFFLNMLVWRGELAGDASFVELLEQVRRTTLEVYAHADLPFDRLVEVLRPEHDPSRHPFFQVKLDYQNLPFELAQPAGARFTPLDFDYRRVHNDLTLYILDTPEELALTWEYVTELFDLKTLEALADRYEQVLAAVAAEPGVSCSELWRRLDELDTARRLAEEASVKEALGKRLREARRRGVGTPS